MNEGKPGKAHQKLRNNGIKSKQAGVKTSSDSARIERRVAVNSMLNISGVIVPAVIAIMSTPILLTNLGSQGFGIFSIQLAVLVLIGVNDFGVSRAVTLEAIARGGFQSEHALARVVWAGTHLITMVAIVVVLVSLSALFVAMMVLPMSLDEQISWGLLLPASIISLGTLPTRASLEVQERFATANFIRIGGSSLLFAAPAIATFISPSMAATSTAMLMSRLALSIAAIFATRRLLSRSSSTEFFRAIRRLIIGRPNKLHRQLIERGGWLGSAGIASSLIGYVDRFALGILASSTITAHYVVAAELVTKMWLVTGAITSAIMPRLAFHWQDINPDKFSKFLTFYLYCQSIIALSAHIIFTLFGEILMRAWLKDQFDQEMYHFLAILSIGIAINGITTKNYALLIIGHFEKKAAQVQFITLPITIIASSIAAYHFSGLGVAWVFTIRLLIDAFVIRAILPFNSTRSKKGMPYWSIALWIFVLFSVYLFSISKIWQDIYVKFIGQSV